MADFPSTNVRINSQLSPQTEEQDFPLFDTTHGLGGLRTVGTTAEMEAILPRRRVEGMIVYVKGVTAYYALIGTTANSGWTTGFTMGKGGGGGIVGDYVTTFNGLSGAVQGVSAAVPGDGIAVSAATGSVTITNTGVTYISAGSFISVSGNTGTVTITNIGVHSFNGRTGAVNGASLGANTFNGLNIFSAGISASSANVGILDVTNDANVGGTLGVYGNLYVRGTIATINETQLLIEDKYLVLGSTLDNPALGTSAGIYIGTTTAPFASFAYNDTLKSWDSNKNVNVVGAGATGYYIADSLVLSGETLGTGVRYSSLTKVGTLDAGTWNASVIGLTWGGTNKDLSNTGVSGGIVFKDGTGLSVLSNTGNINEYLKSNGSDAAPSWASFSALTGLTADRVKTTATATDTAGTYYLTFVTGAANSTDLYVDTATGITFDPSTDTLSCVKIEAIVDGGTW